MAERVLLADGSHQHSASVQLVSAREDRPSAAAQTVRAILWAGQGKAGQEQKLEMGERNKKKEIEE